MPVTPFPLTFRSPAPASEKATSQFGFKSDWSSYAFASTRGQFWNLAGRVARYNARLLAENAQTNIRQIERYCRKDLGRSPQELFNEQRIIAARALLLETGSVKRVAMELGFKQVSHFCRQFKHYYDITPSEYLTLQERLNRKRRY